MVAKKRKADPAAEQPPASAAKTNDTSAPTPSTSNPTTESSPAPTTLSIKEQQDALSQETELKQSLQKQVGELSTNLKQQAGKVIYEVLPTCIDELDALHKKYKQQQPSQLDHTNAGATTNTTITTFIAEIKPFLLRLIEQFEVMKVYFTLLLPPMSDQQPLQSQVKETTIEMLKSGINSSIHTLDSFTKYHHTRAKLYSKYLKHPATTDYLLSIQNLDTKQYASNLVICNDLRNNTLISYDLCIKNWENLTTSPSQNYTNMF